MRFWNGPQLLLIDELGYLPMPGQDASLLFQVISRRYEHGSIVLTTNRAIADWGAIFEDTTVAAAILDRLLHHATVLSITGDSYRMRRHRDAIASPRPHRAPTRWGIPIVATGEFSPSLTTQSTRREAAVRHLASSVHHPFSEQVLGILPDGLVAAHAAIHGRQTNVVCSAVLLETLERTMRRLSECQACGECANRAVNRSPIKAP
jgi:hypothetical protein